MTDEITPVVFRVSDNQVFAMFPAMPADIAGQYCQCYTHIGQHCAADYPSCMKESTPANAGRYADLKAELEQIGYRLEVIAEATPKHHADRKFAITMLRFRKAIGLPVKPMPS